MNSDSGWGRGRNAELTFRKGAGQGAAVAVVPHGPRPRRCGREAEGSHVTAVTSGRDHTLIASFSSQLRLHFPFFVSLARHKDEIFFKKRSIDFITRRGDVLHQSGQQAFAGWRGWAWVLRGGGRSTAGDRTRHRPLGHVRIIPTTSGRTERGGPREDSGQRAECGREDNTDGMHSIDWAQPCMAGQDACARLGLWVSIPVQQNNGSGGLDAGPGAGPWLGVGPGAG